MVLEWHRFERLTLARLKFAQTPCVYIQAAQAGHPVRVGIASCGLEARYRGGTGYAIDAAMHALTLGSYLSAYEGTTMWTFWLWTFPYDFLVK